MIGVFDSGIGGSTVLKEIIKYLPNQKYIYYSDSINNPYGNKSEKELYNIVKKIVLFLISKGCKAIVIACNTASAICVEKLREEFKEIVFIAIEPAYKMVYDYNPSGKTLVIATKGTIESKKFLALYDKYNNHKTILKPCPGLAELIEKNDKEKINKYILDNLAQYKGIDNIVLGCTHYPLIKDNIKKVLGSINFYDGSKGVSLELKRQLERHDLLLDSKLEITFYDSANKAEKESRFYEIIKS